MFIHYRCEIILRKQNVKLPHTFRVSVPKRPYHSTSGRRPPVLISNLACVTLTEEARNIWLFANLLVDVSVLRLFIAKMREGPYFENRPTSNH